MTEIETTWDTEEVSRIIANDEGLYNRVNRLSSITDDVDRLAHLIDRHLRSYIDSPPYSDVDLDNVDWAEIAAEYMEEE